VELSLAQALEIDAPAALATWRYDIQTVAKSERGIDRVKQGDAVTLLFDARRGSAEFVLRLPR